MTDIQRLTGMLDVLPADRRYWDYILENAIEIAEQYGFQRIDVPVIEETSLFVRGVGTASDFFVNKEMYTIDEGEGESITLRPEFTAGIVRAYLENGMKNWPSPIKLYTIGPIFRRERPQAGRFRQHTQFDMEILGETDPAADLEVMMGAANLYRRLGYTGVVFQLNSTGCPACKPAYVEKLKAYLSQHLDRLAPVDLERMKRNPLRILDSKEAGMDQLLAKAPHIADHLCQDCHDHFQELMQLLNAIGQKFTINFRLVRGIDYYTKTVFEVWAEGIGAQSALLGGGRYDGLAEAIGGPPTPGVGFGAGIERITLALQERDIQPPTRDPVPVLVAHFGGETKSVAVALSFRLRGAGIGARLAFTRDRRSMKSQMREADRHKAKLVLIVGEQEIADNVVTVRPLTDQPQTTVSLEGKVLEEWIQLFVELPDAPDDPIETKSLW